MYTGRVYRRVPSVSTTVYTSVPSVSMVVCHTAVYTARLRAVYTAVFWPCARPVNGPCGGVDGPCTTLPCTRPVHDPCTTVYTACTRPVYKHGPCTGRVHGPYTGRMYKGRVHGLSNLSSLSNVHFTGWASYPKWVGVLPHSWGKTPTLSPLRSKRLARKSKVISNSYFVMCESGHGLFSLPTQLSFTVY